MVCLRSAGALGQCATFPPVLDLEALGRLPPVDQAHRLDIREILRGVEDTGRDPELAEALRAWLERREHRGIGSSSGRALKKVRRMARNGLDRFKPGHT